MALRKGFSFFRPIDLSLGRSLSRLRTCAHSRSSMRVRSLSLAFSLSRSTSVCLYLSGSLSRALALARSHSRAHSLSRALALARSHRHSYPHECAQMYDAKKHTHTHTHCISQHLTGPQDRVCSLSRSRAHSLLISCACLLSSFSLVSSLFVLFPSVSSSRLCAPALTDTRTRTNVHKPMTHKSTCTASPTLLRHSYPQEFSQTYDAQSYMTHKRIMQTYHAQT